MPLYDYRCTECEREIEVMHGISDSGPESCQHCGGAMRKALSPPAIHFKGSGWAKKDAATSAKKSSGKSSTGDKPAESKAEGSSSEAGTSSDAKGDSGSKSKTETKTASTAGSSTD